MLEATRKQNSQLNHHTSGIRYATGENRTIFLSFDVAKQQRIYERILFGMNTEELRLRIT